MLSLGAGSLYGILAQSPLNLLQGGVMTEARAAVFVPKQAPAMVSLLVNPDRLEAFSQLIASPGNRRRSHNQLKQVERSLLANTGLDYEKEVKPWLGEEMTLAVTSLDFDRQQENGVQPGYLLAVNTKDAELSKEFLQLAYTQQAIEGTFDLVFETYKGINLIAKQYLKPADKTRFIASAVVGDFVIFANDLKVLREAINNVQVPDLNLKSSSNYQEALKTISEPRIGIIYGNLPAVSAWISNSFLPETPEASQSLTVTLSLKSQGLVAQTALIGVAGEGNQVPILGQPVGALDYIPADSILTAASVDLKQFWTEVQSGLESSSPLQQFFQQTVNRLQVPIGLNLPEDIFSWVEGEYSLALVPDPDGDEPDWIFVAERIPGVDVDAAIAYLDERAQQQGYSVGRLPVLDKTVTAWTTLQTASQAKITRLDAQVKGVHTTVDNYEIFTTSIEAMSQAIASAENSLVNAKKFQQAISALPKENDGYFYVDWRQSEPILQEKVPILRVFEFAAKPLFNNLRSFTLSSQGSNNGVRRATAFLNLGVKY